jgi:PhnB protein
MSIKSLNPYLNFDGDAHKAIALYESALGAKAEGVMRFGDMPGQPAPPEVKDRIMHAKLQVGGGVIMISDGPPGRPRVTGNNNYVALHFDDPTATAKTFEALAAGGTVEMPLQDTFWGAKFGMLTDVFGVHWMFNCELPKAT